MSERTAEATTTVDEDGIRVEKSFTDDAFPVPAVTYELSSTREDPVRVRIVDRIPESFPMDRIGFHPEYESENWTAYKDHRVEFERVIDPDDAIETVFGIRDDDPDLDGFLGTPVIEHVPVGEEIEDVLGTGDTDAVREVLSGDRATLPGMEEPTAEADDDGTAVGDASDESDGSEAPEPRTVSANGTAAVSARDAEPAAAGDSESPPDPAEESEAAEPDDETEGRGPATLSAPATSPEGGLAAALAAEIRAGEVADEDLETIGEELDVGVPRSVDVRISRLQSSVADIEAYADALAEFIDSEGTARELLDDLDETVESVESEVSALEDRVDAADADRDDLREEVTQVDDSVDAVTERVDAADERVDGVEATIATVEGSVDAVSGDVSRLDEETTALEEAVDDLGDDVETLYEGVDDASARAEAADARVDDLESRLGRFDEEFDDLWGDLAEVDTRLTEIEDRLGEDLDDVEAEIEAINDHLAELEAFRKRLNEAFGP
ncbi:hypothetical protein U4E84_13315 [Halorubrum sp. AD140]|uniref:hypothetical protein n=1 Tax=Halorubrum sp. AD140 TaxID=3050073 RepID=UPI002ACCFE24|nr:hypothetical protein [Halorubrum sp. AD140]MDZ5812322.1 hypothetical protein [Halorubrum sp. AD140]